MKPGLAMVMSLWLCAGCATEALLNATDPAEYVAVPMSEISEAKLTRRGLDFYRDDKRQLYYVEKTQMRKLGDYTMRVLGAPVTVAVDAAPYVVVIGVALYFEAISVGTIPNTPSIPPPQDPEERAYWDDVVRSLKEEPVK